MSTFYPSPPPQHHQRRVGTNTSLEIPRSSYPSPPHAQNTTSPYNPHLRYNPASYNNNGNSPISPYPNGLRVASQSPHRSGEYNPRDFGNLEYGRVVTPPVQQFQSIQPQQTGDRKHPPIFLTFPSIPIILIPIYIYLSLEGFIVWHSFNTIQNITKIFYTFSKHYTRNYVISDI